MRRRTPSQPRKRAPARSERIRTHTGHAALAVAVLALVGAGIYALFGEFAAHAWRSGIRGASAPMAQPEHRLMSSQLDQVATAQTWRGLVLAPEHRCSPYERTDYAYPQSVEAQIVASMGGRIYGPYTGRTFASTRQTDIEHMVATSEAHDSGLCAADAATRRAFARDLINLTLAAPEVNRCGSRGKCGKDAGEWLPARNGCWFAAKVILVKLKYGLTVDRREAQALEQVLSNCSSTDMMFHAASTHGGQRPGKPAPSPAAADTDALARWDDNRNGRISCAEARRHGIAPVASGHPAYRYMRDGDNDGVVCE